jgi:hypothetical protein
MVPKCWLVLIDKRLINSDNKHATFNQVLVGALLWATPPEELLHSRNKFSQPPIVTYAIADKKTF